MFAQALQKVSAFTFPVISSKHLENGSVQCGCGTFIVINREGWIVTAAHLLQELLAAQAHASERAQYARQVEAIHHDPSILPKHKSKQIARLPRNKDWITAHSYFWGTGAGVTLRDIRYDNLRDLAVGRLEPFDPKTVLHYPIFRNPSAEILPGTSLCRLGFPFHEISATYDSVANQFSLAPGVLPMPRFPNDGIHTRLALIVEPQSNRSAKFLETSTPGLRGQSGGPIFDVEGNVCAIQSRTVSLPLGITPAVRQGNREIIEHQFLHVGHGAHVEEVLSMLKDCGIQHETS